MSLEKLFESHKNLANTKSVTGNTSSHIIRRKKSKDCHVIPYSCTPIKELQYRITPDCLGTQYYIKFIRGI